MANVVPISKAASVNPLKSSQPLGAAFAFLGIDKAVPLFHGSQGCTSFALVLFVRHFKETVPLQTTAMDEVATILGGADHLEEAILNLKMRTRPELIGVCTTALVETRGEDFKGDIAGIRRKRSEELAGTEVVLAETPDFEGAIEEGWTKAVVALIEGITDRSPREPEPQRVNILPGWHLTVADVAHLRDLAEAFGLDPVILPDISGALDGTVPDRWIPTTYGGTRVADIRRLGEAVRTLVIGEHMRAPARRLEELTGVPYTLFDTITGLKPADRFIMALAELSGRPVPPRLRRARSQLQDALLDGHFHFSGKRVAVAAEPDHLYMLATFFAGLGAEVAAAVTTAGTSPVLAKVPAETVHVGDLMDFEDRAAGVDLLVTHSHGRQASERLGIPLLRVGFPIFDRLGSQHRLSIGYEGTRNLIFEAANMFQACIPTPTPEALDPFRGQKEKSNERETLAAH